MHVFVARLTIYSSLGLLVRRVKEPQSAEIVDTLCNHMLNEKKDDLREISNIGLKTIIAQMVENTSTPASVVKRLTPRLIGGITTVKVSSRVLLLNFCYRVKSQKLRCAAWIF